MPPAVRVASRVAVVVLGGYAATVGLVALCSVALARFGGVPRSEALTLTTIIGFLGYTAVVIWGFAERSLARLFLVLGLVAAVSHAAAIWFARVLPPAPAVG